VAGAIFSTFKWSENCRAGQNEQSKRRVPLHPVLIAAGFLKYVEEIAPSDEDPLFPQLPPGGADNKRGHSFTQWWTRYRRDIGLYEKFLDYHSFRHGVTTKLYAADVKPVVIDELTGHEGQGTSRVVYTKDMPLSQLFDAICKVEWPEVELLKRG
jgi:integrase